MKKSTARTAAQEQANLNNKRYVVYCHRRQFNNVEYYFRSEEDFDKGNFQLDFATCETIRPQQ